ncbi:hypothetical protein EON63_08135 [archaeon]|nr:MAG: hypothetical protein EON63_08135 [archaeon]
MQIGTMICTPTHLHVVSVVAAYWVVSISMVYLNKILLSNDQTSITAPLFVTWYAKSAYILYIPVYLTITPYPPSPPLSLLQVPVPHHLYHLLRAGHLWGA